MDVSLRFVITMGRVSRQGVRGHGTRGSTFGSGTDSLRFPLVSVTPIPRALTVSEAAAASNVSRMTIRREIARGNLRARRICRVLRIIDTELARWLEDYDSNATPPKRPPAGAQPS